MEEWRRIDGDHYQAKFYSGTFDARRIDGEWTLWFQANMTRGFIRKPGTWKHLAKAKHQAKIFDNDHFLNRS
jgi:hypothetical protein